MQKLKYILLLIPLLLLLSACNHHNNKHHHPKDMLRVDLGSEPPTLDPQLAEDVSSSRVLFDLFAGLVDFDQRDNVIPGLASKYDISKDGKTYTFHLRHNLKFSNGTPITAQDFVYSWQRVVTPKTASPYSFLLDNVVNGQAIIAGKLKPNKLGVTALNKYTFVVHLVKPDPMFIKYCTRPNLMVVPEEIIARYGKSWTTPQHMVTSGAYKLKQHVVDGYILAEKNPYYYGASGVHIKKVKYIPYVDINTGFDAYKAGDVDVAALPVNRTIAMDHYHPSEVHINQLEGIYYLDLNMKLPLLANNIKLRQALSMAINRQVLVKHVLLQKQTPLYSYVTPTIENGKYAGIVYNWADFSQAKRHFIAKKLYKEAGFSRKHPLHVVITYNTSDLNKKVILAVASMWEKVLGVKTEIHNRGWSVFIQERRTGDYVIARDGWLPDYNGVSAYTLLYLCNGLQNRAHYCNPQYDSLINAAQSSINPENRQLLYGAAIKLAMNDYPTIPLFQYTYAVLVKPYVKGYDPKNNYLNHVQSKWFRF